MPRTTDTDLNREKEEFINLSQIWDCPECDNVQELEFKTAARDEDGLADIVPEELKLQVTCANPECRHKEEVQYEGWASWGSA